MSLLENTFEIHKKLFEAYRKRTGHLPEGPREYRAGQYIFSVGERPRGIYYVSKGLVKIFRESDKDPVVRISGPHSFIGFVSLIKRWDYASSAQVLEQAQIEFIPKTIFLELLQTDLAFARMVIEILCDQLAENQARLADMAEKDTYQRLAALLLSLEMAYDEDTKTDHALIQLPKKDIAAAIATTPETVSRYLARLAQEGHIALVEKNIEVLNRSALLHLSEVKD